MKTEIKINVASVKVMRSFDYCHFEVALSTSELSEDQEKAKVQADALRKEAARLVDKAVQQYKVAKLNEQLADGDQWKREALERRAALARSKPESERTPEEKATLKKLEDDAYLNRRRYDYEDDWDEPEWDDDNDL